MIQELRIRVNDKRPDPFWFCLLVKLFILIVTLIFIAGCINPTVIDSGSGKAQARTIKAVLSDCVAQPVGQVGSTNKSLATGYIRSTESLFICQEISLGIIQGLNNDKED